MKKHSWKLFVSALIVLLLVVACSEQEPAAEEDAVVEEVQEVAPDSPDADESAEPVEPVQPAEPAEEAEAVEPADAPEISQPIYRWGEVADRHWVLVAYGDALNPVVVEEGLVMTASFSSTDGQVSGSAGCNNYFAGYESTDDGGLTIKSPIGMTMMACPEGMEAEQAFVAALETVSAWTLNDDGNLELTYSSGQPFEEKLMFVPGETSLTGTVWQLVNFGDPEEPTVLEEGTSITAVFLPETDTTGTVGGNATCNNYSGGYTLDGSNISFGPIAGTMMMCIRGMEQETAYLAALQSAQTYEIIGPNMQIAYDGGVLNYTSLNLPLENVLWQAIVVGGQPVSEDVQITALFTTGEEVDSGSVGGNSGCNNYNTGYETSSDLSTNPPTHFIRISSPMAMTMMACPGEDLAQLERSYLGLLETAESYEILGDQMILHSADGDIQFAADRQPLLGTHWSLVSIGDLNDPQTPVEGSNFTAVFNRLPTLPTGTVTGETGCNDYNATFAADLTNIKINLPQKSNNEDCPWGAGNFEVEQQFFLGLNSANRYRIVGSNLQLISGEGDAQQVMNFVATQPDVEGPALDLTPLTGTFWYLSAMGDTPILAGTEITAGFDIKEDGVTGEISGSGGCNAYNAALGENFAVGAIASTKKACPPPVMDQENAYFAWLSSAYGFDRAGDQLLIPTSNGVLTFSSTPVLDQSRELQNTTWYLISYETLNAIAGSNPTAFFSGDGRTVSGNTGCNEYNGSYSAEQGNKLTISGFSTTRAGCASDALSKQEETFLRLMPAAVSYAVNGTQLQIVTADGGVMNFSSIPPAAPTGPTAVIVSGDFADTGQQLTFDGAQSKAGSLPIVRYDWDMGDGTRLNGAQVKYTYNNPGNYTVSLTVSDQGGLSDTATKSVQVNPVVEVVPPTAVIEGPSAAFVGDPVTFSAADSQQGTAAIANYQWQSGDGNDTGLVPESSFTTVYSQPGTYYPSVTVADAGGLSDSASMAITINAGLTGTSWLLSNTIPGTSISLEFGNGSLSGFAGCNSYSAGYTSTRAAGTTNQISVGPITSSQALCSEEIMTQEQSYLASLQTASSYTIDGSTLTLATTSGSLVYSAGVPTPYAEPAVQPAVSQ
jgi:heat shock protein HslJ